MRDDEPAQLDEALDTLSSGWLLRRYPWAGSLSTAHTVLYYDRHGRDVFRRLASVVRGGVIGASSKLVPARFDLAAAADALGREAEVWQHLVQRRAQGLARSLRRRHRRLRRVARSAGPLPRAGRRGAGAPPAQRPRPPPLELAQRSRLTWFTSHRDFTDDRPAPGMGDQDRRSVLEGQNPPGRGDTLAVHARTIRQRRTERGASGHSVKSAAPCSRALRATYYAARRSQRPWIQRCQRR